MMVCQPVQSVGISKKWESGAIRPPGVPLLSPANRRKRFAFAMQHRDWTVEDWKTAKGPIDQDAFREDKE